MLNRLTDLLEISLGCSVVIALLLLLTPVLSRYFSPRLRYWAWALLAVRLLLPGMPWGESAVPTPIQVQAPQTITAPTYDGMKQDIKDALPYGYRGDVVGSTTVHVWYSDDQNNSIRAYDNPIFRLEAYNNTWSVSFHWEGVWKLGLILCLGWQLFSYLAFVRRVRRWSVPATLEDLTALDAQQLAVGTFRRVSLVRCELVASPLLMGFIKPTIVLPSQLPEHTLAPSLAHELTHLKRGDLWYQLLLRITHCVHWFNPLVWLMVRQAKRDMELCCDYDLLHSQGEEARRAYGQAILDQMTASRGVSPLTTGFSGDKKTIFTRFKAIMDTSPKKKGTAVLVLILCAAALAGGLVACSGSSEKPHNSPAGQPLQVSLESDTSQQIAANYYEQGFDWEYHNLPALQSYKDSDAVLLYLPEGVDPSQLLISEDHYRSDNVYEPDRINMIERRDPVPTYLADSHALSLPVTRTNPGAEEKSVFFLTWGKSSQFRYVFRVEFAAPSPELTLTDVFDLYVPNPFSVSTTEYDSIPYYKFENTPADISILMPEQCRTAPSIISYRGRTMTAILPCNPLSGCKYGNAGGRAYFVTADLTGDGSDELVYVWGYGGTGLWEDRCKIFDLTTMEELPVSMQDDELLTHYIQAELVAYDSETDREHTAIFRLTTGEGDTVYATTAARNTAQQPGPAQLLFDGHTHLTVEETQLKITLAISPDNIDTFMPTLSYLGEISGSLAYSPSLRAFTLSPPFAVNVFNPMEY